MTCDKIKSCEIMVRTDYKYRAHEYIRDRGRGQPKKEAIVSPGAVTLMSTSANGRPLMSADNERS